MLADRIRTVRLVAFDFDGVFTDNMVYVFEDGREAVRCSRADGLGLSRLKELNVNILILSTETNPVVTARAQKLGVRCVQGCSDKRAALDEALQQLALTAEQAAFVGNDVNDLACLTYVGLPIVVADAHPSVMPHALYRTTRPGGHGAVREVCDMIAECLVSKPS